MRYASNATLPYQHVAGALQALDTDDIWAGTKLAFRFLVLTATRSGEVRGATWPEIDRTNMLWTIPGSRMKAGVEQRTRRAQPLDGRTRLLAFSQADAEAERDVP